MNNAFVYILSSKSKVLYIGVTSDLKKRIYQHKEGLCEGFTKKYKTKYLVYYEAGDSIEGAIVREKQLKGKNRIKKIKLIESINPEWRDLYYNL
jgi:putative endonuclease